MSAPTIILFRRPQKEDPFEKVFVRAGWNVESIPVLAFEYQNQDKLEAALNKPDDYAGIIVTSPRAGDLLGSVFQASDPVCKSWQSKPVICIGKRTAESIIACKHVPHISDRADSSAVAEKVVVFAEKRPWIFICGNLRRDELPEALSQADVAFEELVVYKTLPATSLNLTQFDRPQWVVFFSPSGVKAVSRHWPDNWQHTQSAAIGNTTANAMAEMGWSVGAIAERPEPQALLEAIQQKMDRVS